ncbi:hypothetical protein J5N97_026142 [Dioscorea zingiberensis]|uniref:Uncharacterized protein n=1 Tax=Dioscorea zingiberensis TaxID=325984 RepID=A0A9D5C2U3_9LILI|nr:hypothetical protein J5N97_026142 [Dioscorea zingiberensis]
MGQLNYTRLGRIRWRRMRGFRLNSHHRCSVHRLRVRLLRILHALAGCLKPLKRAFRRSTGNMPCERSMSGRGLVFEEQQRPSSAGAGFKQRHCSRSNSFYAEAIADCLEFIKRSSVSVDNINHENVDENFIEDETSEIR